MDRAIWGICFVLLVNPALADDTRRDAPPGFTPGRGYGWIWGNQDEVGALNAMTDATRLAAVRLVKTGKTYDLGVTYDRTSYKWPGHNPGEIITFRSPEGVKRQQDMPTPLDGPAWHSCALFISDNVGTQIDGLGHITSGADNHWYNGFRESDWGGNWGIRKCGAETIPPIIARGVLIDVAALKGVDALPSRYPVGVDDLRATLERQKTTLHPGDVVLIRTGTGRYWGQTGSDHARIGEHDSAGLTLAGARWLVEQNGSMMIGSDTSGLEAPPPPDDKTGLSVHQYLLVEQGVHIGELHFLEDLSRDQVYEFCYIAATNKIKGAAAGFTLRPIALR